MDTSIDLEGILPNHPNANANATNRFSSLTSLFALIVDVDVRALVWTFAAFNSFKLTLGQAMAHDVKTRVIGQPLRRMPGVVLRPRLVIPFVL